MITTISKPKFSKYLLKSSVDEIFEALSPFIEWVNVESKVDACRDAGDNFILALAKDGNAKYIITGDKDLIALSPFENTSILTMAVFLDILESQ